MRDLPKTAPFAPGNLYLRQFSYFLTQKRPEIFRDWSLGMERHMARATNPDHIQGSRIIGVMLFQTFRAFADAARLRHQFSTALIRICIGSGISAPALLVGKLTMAGAMRSLVIGMAWIAIPLTFAGNINSTDGTCFHSLNVPRKQKKGNR